MKKLVLLCTAAAFLALPLTPPLAAQDGQRQGDAAQSDSAQLGEEAQRGDRGERGGRAERGENGQRGNRGQREKNSPVRGRQFVPSSSPSLIVAAESRFARMAQEEGQWTAFRETATEEAFGFTPDLQNMVLWLDGKDDPAKADSWDPYHIIMSCDGSLAAATGAWRAAGGGNGVYTSIWQQQVDGEYRLIFHDVQRGKTPEGDPSAVTSTRASCDSAGRTPQRSQSAATAPQDGKKRKRKKRRSNKLPENLPVKIAQSDGETTVSSWSRDGTMSWEAIQNQDGSNALSVFVLDNGHFVEGIFYIRPSPKEPG